MIEQNRIPDAGRRGGLESDRGKVEPVHANAILKLDALNRGRCIPQPFEVEHHVCSGLDVTIFLLDQVVEIFRGPALRILRQQTINLYFAHRAMLGSIVIERNFPRQRALMPDGLSAKGPCRNHVVLRPEHEVHRLADPFHCPIQVHPFVAYLQISLVYTS